jgi:hypothetical protein
MFAATTVQVLPTWLRLKLPVWLRPMDAVLLDALAILAVMAILFLILRRVFPRVTAIAHTTMKEAVSQPLFYVLLFVGVAAMIIFPFVPYFTFGEDVKMLKATGLTVIKLLAIFLALWTSSISIFEEIENRTVLTLLSKPIRRYQLILGKFLGIVVPVALMFVILGVVFLGSVSYKVSYDAKETSNPDPTAEECAEQMEQIVPGLVLAFFETLVLASISVAISTRLPIMANLTICAAVYMLGHLASMFVDSPVGREFEIVRFMGLLLAAILPGLEHFSVETAISTGQAVPMMYLGVAALYALLYSTVAMLVALLLFEDRDLA